jgi:proline iminopeptidase
MLTLYPAIEPFSHYHLTINNNGLASEENISNKGKAEHHIYVEQCGNPLGIPVVFLHGGPGSGCRESHRRYFDPKLYHIILFDQRGCGRSYPYGALKGNTTTALIQDIEVIRQHVGIEKWLVFGGSWGATLGLHYAQHFPAQVSGLVLRGVFLAREQDIDWVYSENGAAKLFPDTWYNLIKELPPSQQAQPLAYIYQQLNSDNAKVSLAIFNKLQRWEAKLVSLQEPAIIEEITEEAAKVPAIIQLYYSINQCFIAEKPLLEHIDIIRHIPTTIIHGRYDMVCPLEQAWQLKTHWPEAELTIVEMAGHVASEPKIIDALIKATNDFAKGK